MRKLTLIVAALLSLAFALPAGAAEPKITLNENSTIKDVLAQHAGKRVSVRTDAGETLDGTVVKITGQLVHIEKLAGREFFDAVVRIDRISSVTFRTKTQ